MPDPQQGAVVYKLCTASAWAEAIASGAFTGSADDLRDGYIHLSTAAQLPGTAQRHFRGQADLVLVALDAGRLGPALRWETSRAGALFPHLYAPLAVRCALWVRPLRLDSSGVPLLPEDVAP